MERKEAVALLRELVNNNLAESSLVSIEKNPSGDFNLIMKDYCGTKELKLFVAGKNLKIDVDEQKGYCIIHKS
ncbi:MAG: hypothetical protein ABSG33_10370 [Candidatus Bathyarchaeia archaeon]